MHLEASFSFLGLPIQKLGMVEGQMGFSPIVRGCCEFQFVVIAALVEGFLVLRSCGVFC